MSKSQIIQKKRQIPVANGTMKLSQITRPKPRKKMSHAYSVNQSSEICKTLDAFQLKNVLSDVYLEHLNDIVHSVFMLGYGGKIVNTTPFSDHHRTSVAHFLNNGRWNSHLFDKLQRKRVVARVYRESRRAGKPVLCIVDDTIASHTKPSSRAEHPIEAVISTSHWTYKVYRYQGKLNDCEDAVVLISYPEQTFGEAQALRAFISTQTDLTTQEIFEFYVARWNIEVFFRSCKQKLAFNKCQLRKKQGIERFWLILSLVHYMCCTIGERSYLFDEGYAYYRNCVLKAAFAESALA